VLATLAWGALVVYIFYQWITRIWPTLRAPSELNEDEYVLLKPHLTKPIIHILV